MAEVGETIRRLRLHQGWSQCKLAAEAGVSQATVSMIESGRRGCSQDALKQIGRALRVPPEIILWQSMDVPESMPDEIRQLLEATNNLVTRFLEQEMARSERDSES